MKKVIKHLRLPFSFSATMMQQEVAAITAQWTMHYQQSQYSGEWSALPLRSINGSLNSIIVDGKPGDQFADTPLMALCPYLKIVVATLQCEKTTVRLLNLKPGSVIKEHKDTCLNFENGEARIHIPIATNAGVEFYLEDEKMVLKEGECWYMNFNLRHKVANKGQEDRIHLVIDCLVNDWMREIFDSSKDKSEIIAEEQFSQTEKMAIINQLRELNTESSLQIAAEMESAT